MHLARLLPARLVEHLLSITTIIYFLGGLTLLVVAAVALGSPSALAGILSYVPNITNLSQVVSLTNISLAQAIYMIVEGSIIVIISPIAFVAVGRRRIPVVATCTSINVLMFWFNVAVTTFWDIDPTVIQSNVQYQMNQTFQSTFIPPTITSLNSTGVVIYPSNVTNPSAYSWNMMQLQESCCGVVGISDYQTSSFNKSSWYANIGISNAVVPASCCMTSVYQAVPVSPSGFVNVTACLTTSLSSPTDVYPLGCLNYVLGIVEQYNYIWSVSASLSAVVQGTLLTLVVWFYFGIYRLELRQEIKL